MAGCSAADLIRLAGDIHQIGGVLGHLLDFGLGEVIHPFDRGVAVLAIFSRLSLGALFTLGTLFSLRALGAFWAGIAFGALPGGNDYVAGFVRFYPVDRSHQVGGCFSGIGQVAGSIQPRQVADGSAGDLIRLAGDIHQIGGVLGHLRDFRLGEVIHPFDRGVAVLAIFSRLSLGALFALGTLLTLRALRTFGAGRALGSTAAAASGGKLHPCVGVGQGNPLGVLSGQIGLVALGVINHIQPLVGRLGVIISPGRQGNLS